MIKLGAMMERVKKMNFTFLSIRDVHMSLYAPNVW